MPSINIRFDLTDTLAKRKEKVQRAINDLLPAAAKAVLHIGFDEDVVYNPSRESDLAVARRATVTA